MFGELLAPESTFSSFLTFVRERIDVVSYKLSRKPSSIVVMRDKSKIVSFFFFFLNKHPCNSDADHQQTNSKRHCLRATPRDLMKEGKIPQDFPLGYETLNVSKVCQKIRGSHST